MIISRDGLSMVWTVLPCELLRKNNCFIKYQYAITSFNDTESKTRLIFEYSQVMEISMASVVFRSLPTYKSEALFQRLTLKS